MQNPWLQLPENGPFVLPSDREAITNFNKKVAAGRRIDLELLPEPFIGRLDAEIVILMTNPGWSPWDRLIYASIYPRSCYDANLRQQDMDFPFYMLDPQLIAGLDPSIPKIKPRVGPYWWMYTLRRLIEVSSVSRVSKSILGVEYFPYHSVNNPRMREVLESQRFSFELVRQAMERQAVILVSRSIKHWFRAVPELESYSNLHQRAPKMRNAMITPVIHPTGYDAARQILESID